MRRSLFEDHGPAKLVIEPRGHEIEILTDAIVPKRTTSSGCEAHVAGRHEYVVILNTS